MKKLFALILALSVLCSFSVIAQAADNTVADDTAMLEENMILAREKATTFLNDFDSSLNVTLSDPVILYNAQQEPEAASFTINPSLPEAKRILSYVKSALHLRQSLPHANMPAPNRLCRGAFLQNSGSSLHKRR